MVFSDHTSKTGNFMNVVQRILEKLPTKDNSAVYQYGEYYFDVVVEFGVVYLAMTDQSFPRDLPPKFLQDIKKRFQVQYGDSGGEAGPTAGGDFARVLQNTMEYFNSAAGRGDARAQKLRQEVDEVKDVMVHNIEKVLERGEKIELLVDKTDQLSAQSTRFKKSAVSLKRSMWWQNIKMMGCIGCVFVFVAVYIASKFCGGFSFCECHGDHRCDGDRRLLLAEPARNLFHSATRDLRW